MAGAQFAAGAVEGSLHINPAGRHGKGIRSIVLGGQFHLAAVLVGHGEGIQFVSFVRGDGQGDGETLGDVLGGNGDGTVLGLFHGRGIGGHLGRLIHRDGAALQNALIVPAGGDLHGDLGAGVNSGQGVRLVGRARDLRAVAVPLISQNMGIAGNTGGQFGAHLVIGAGDGHLAAGGGGQDRELSSLGIRVVV